MVIAVWTIAILLALVGTAMLAYSAWKSIRRLRRRGKACVQCGYPRPSGENAPVRCPECGTAYDAKPSIARRTLGVATNLARLAFAVASLALLATLIWPFRAARVLEPLCATWVEASRTDLGSSDFVQEEMAFRGQLLRRVAGELHRFNVYVGMEAGSLQRAKLIDHSGRVAFETEGRDIDLGSSIAPADQGAVATSPFWTVDPSLDIDADGVPDVIVETYSGGAHCCWTYVVISLSDPPRVTFTLDSAVGARFDLDPTAGGNTTLIHTADTTFAYWRTSYVESPMPGVTMRLSHGQTTIAAELMRRPAPSPQELASEAAKVREAIRADVAAKGAKELSVADYWRTPLDLMYSGHEDLAWKFFDDAWPAEGSGKDEFLREFRGVLDRSTYWSRVKAAFAAFDERPTLPSHR